MPDDVFGITTVTIPTKPIQLCSPVKSDQSQLRPPSSHGIGRGKRPPEKDFVDFVFEGFRLMERGVANELKAFIDFANRSYAKDEFSRIDFKEVQRIAGTCVTGCAIADPGSVEEATPYKGFTPRLVRCAHEAYKAEGERRKA